MNPESQQQWYKPKDIARLRLIVNSTGGDKLSANYHFVLQLLKRGKLKGRDYSNSRVGRPFWLVSKDEIERYNREAS